MAAANAGVPAANLLSSSHLTINHIEISSHVIPLDPATSTEHQTNQFATTGSTESEIHDAPGKTEHKTPKDTESSEKKHEDVKKNNGHDDQKEADTNEDNSTNHLSKSDKDADDTKSVAESEPPGGYDATPIPNMPPGYTLQITIHRAKNLPMADINTLSSDPYVITQMYTYNLTRHKEDPTLKMRTFTVRKEVDPEWNARWVVANVPTSGFRLKCRIYDEDPADHDDRLGNAHINIPHLDDNWKGFKEKDFKIKKRMGSKRAYAVQAVAAAIGKRHSMDGHLIVSIENMGRTESDHGGRVYTVGPSFWIKHYSPLLGRAMGQKTPGNKSKEENIEGELAEEDQEKPKTQRYNFQANQLQLNGPVPAELYHRYVEFRPFVKRMFTGKGLRGFLMNKVLLHQHDQIYHFDRSTEYGYLSDKPNKETTLKFLDLVHYDEGGRIFTYILTLDALMRFTETGKEFGVQMLSKHTLHSAAETYIAFSGEFLVRRLKNKNDAPPEEGNNNESCPSSNIKCGPPDGQPPKDPSQYELIVDNDSGTYRPNANLLPKFKQFLEHALPGLHVVVLDCQKNADEQQAIKKEQRQKKKDEGDNVIYKPISRGSSISSSDESDLDAAMDGGDNRNEFLKTVKHDLSARGNMKKLRWKNKAKGVKKNEEKAKAKASEQTNGTNGIAVNENGTAV